MSRPRIGLSRWENVTGERIEAYRRRIRAAGLEPVDLHEPADRLDGCTGLVLSGGIDVDPERYGEPRQAAVPRVNPARDSFELDLLQQALTAGMPVLAICRGHQLLNVHLGGSLLQHIEDESHEVQDDDVTSGCHTVSLGGGSKLVSLYGAGSIEVNSRHHQAVTSERLAPGLTVAGISSDGMIEAVEAEAFPWVVGVQWHPERVEPQIAGFEERSVALFAAFAAAVRS